MESKQMILGVLRSGLVCLVAAGSASGQAAPPRPQMAEEIFKNVQILKGIPVDEFMDTMGMFAAALSMNCTDCHTEESTTDWARFADETVPKQKARQMMLMVNNLNRNSFRGTQAVTCWTCHRGDPRPENVPNLAIQYGTPIDDPNDISVFPPSGQPSPDEVFNRYIEALGGTQRVAAMTGFTAKGTYEGYDTDFAKAPIEIFARPGQRTTIVHAGFGDKTSTYDGRAGWIASLDKPMPLMPLTGGNLEAAKFEAMAIFPSQIRQAFSQWRVTATDIDEQGVRVLQGSNPGQPPVNLYFDESGLLVRLLRFVDTPVGRVPMQIDYADYRDVAGVKLPFKWTSTWTTGQTTTELTEVQPNAAIDAARFVRPAPATPPK